MDTVRATGLQMNISLQEAIHIYAAAMSRRYGSAPIAMANERSADVSASEDAEGTEVWCPVVVQIRFEPGQGHNAASNSVSYGAMARLKLADDVQDLQRQPAA